MSALAEKIRRSREVLVTCGRHSFTVMRPTAMGRDEGIKALGATKYLLSLVVGWDGVTEGDILPGGDPHPLPFDADACAEWLSDRPDLFTAITNGIVSAFEAYAAKLDDDLKN